MKKTFIFVIVLVVGLLVYIATQKNMTTELKTESIVITPIEHASAVISWGDNIIYADPVGDLARFDGQAIPNIILLTDIHGDHLDLAVLEALATAETTLVMPQAVADKLTEGVLGIQVVLNNGETFEKDGLKIEALPMYNLPESEESYHVKGRGNGYVLNFGGKRLYLSGDTAGIPEMRALSDINLALVAMNLPYTMDVVEAAEAVLDFAPKQVYPYHYRGPEGLSDVSKFKEIVNAGNPDIEVVLLNWYPEN
jgi:L-ascorbate metabolism protein UlaG (beta-lactamase superfamily)